MVAQFGRSVVVCCVPTRTPSTTFLITCKYNAATSMVRAEDVLRQPVLRTRFVYFCGGEKKNKRSPDMPEKKKKKKTLDKTSGIIVSGIIRKRAAGGLLHSPLLYV